MLLKTLSLNSDILKIIRDKGTETPHSGLYNDWEVPGTFLCRNCGLALFRSQSKFHSGCGWPSFEGEIPGNIITQQDRDGRRQEILCSRCEAHLGHVFTGEGYTPKNLRHCVNSLSLDFVPDLTIQDTEEALFAGGCFWGVEYLFKSLPGVLKTEVGYAGGGKDHPSYEEVCSGRTGHYESIRIIYDPQKISYKDLVKHFFQIHDPTQKDGQGPDKGEQYLSVIFYYDENQKKTSEDLIKELVENNYEVATRLLPISSFWPAEDYHQDYYGKNKKMPYCHFFVKRFK